MGRGCWQHVDQDFHETDALECFFLFDKKGLVVKIYQSSAFAELWHWMSHCFLLYVFCSFVVVVCYLALYKLKILFMLMLFYAEQNLFSQERERERDCVCVVVQLNNSFSTFLVSPALFCSTCPFLSVDFSLFFSLDVNFSHSFSSWLYLSKYLSLSSLARALSLFLSPAVMFLTAR